MTHVCVVYHQVNGEPVAEVEGESSVEPMTVVDYTEVPRVPRVVIMPWKIKIAVQS